ncbi:hypothetical protein LXL04_005488 [Taraxacum kok-saghyz]
MASWIKQMVSQDRGTNARFPHRRETRSTMFAAKQFWRVRHMNSLTLSEALMLKWKCRFIHNPDMVMGLVVKAFKALGKQLDRNGLQGNREFLVEVLMLSLLHHPNLVNLIGYCADGDQRLLVYEFMPLGSLEDHLHDFPAEKEALDWNTRMKIAGAAKGPDILIKYLITRNRTLVRAPATAAIFHKLRNPPNTLFSVAQLSSQ